MNERILFAAGAPIASYARVQFRCGYRGQRDRIAVSFVLPTSGGAETLTISVAMCTWGALAPEAWRQMLLTYIPMGVLDYPVQA